MGAGRRKKKELGMPFFPCFFKRKSALSYLQKGPSTLTKERSTEIQVLNRLFEDQRNLNQVFSVSICFSVGFLFVSISFSF